jgi:hypothetical protein
MRQNLIALLVTLTFVSGPTSLPLFARAAASNTTDEVAIRQAISQWDDGKALPRTTDSIFWSGAYKKPVVGTEKPEEIPGPNQPSARKADSQRHKTTIHRIEVAKSSDLAYEFSDSVLSFAMPGKPVQLPTSVLRVWRKESGEWKVAAQFSRPLYQEGQSAPEK